MTAWHTYDGKAENVMKGSGKSQRKAEKGEAQKKERKGEPNSNDSTTVDDEAKTAQ